MQSHILRQDGWFLEHLSSQEHLLVHHNFLVIFVSITFFALSTLLEIVQCWTPLSSVVKTLMTFHYISWLFFFGILILAFFIIPISYNWVTSCPTSNHPPGWNEHWSFQPEVVSRCLVSLSLPWKLLHGPPLPTPPSKLPPQNKGVSYPALGTSRWLITPYKVGPY